jgi:hypothetical protein
MDVHELQRALMAIDRVLEDPTRLDADQPMTTGDPIADEWERALAEGREPDWDLGKSTAPKKVDGFTQIQNSGYAT